MALGRVKGVEVGRQMCPYPRLVSISNHPVNVFCNEWITPHKQVYSIQPWCSFINDCLVQVPAHRTLRPSGYADAGRTKLARRITYIRGLHPNIVRPAKYDFGSQAAVEINK